jgi:hypothetical protein
MVVHAVVFGMQGVKLHYVESGDRDSPLLLLLHGFPDCWLSWRYQIPVLAQHYRWVRLRSKLSYSETSLSNGGDGEPPVMV